MERLFRSLKSEWVPSTGYLTAQEAQRDISHYLMHRYNWIRPHQFNDGLPPAVAEKTQPTVRDGLTTTKGLLKPFKGNFLAAYTAVNARPTRKFR